MDELEALETGVELLVILQYGCNNFLSSMDCSECSEEECVANGCTLGSRDITYMEEPLYIPQINKEFFNCPIGLIPPIVYSMFDKYNRMEKFKQSLSDTDTSNLFWWFVKTYERIKSDIERQIHEASMKKNK